MQKITPFLWFDDRAEEAMHFYTSIFKNSKIGSVSRYGEGGPGGKGKVMSATFELEGQEFFALNGGPQYSFTPAISFFVDCKTPPEVDELRERPSAGAGKGGGGADALRGGGGGGGMAPAAEPIRRHARGGGEEGGLGAGAAVREGGAVQDEQGRGIVCGEEGAGRRAQGGALRRRRRFGGGRRGQPPDSR